MYRLGPQIIDTVNDKVKYLQKLAIKFVCSAHFRRNNNANCQCHSYNVGQTSIPKGFLICFITFSFVNINS